MFYKVLTLDFYPWLGEFYPYLQRIGNDSIPGLAKTYGSVHCFEKIAEDLRKWSELKKLKFLKKYFMNSLNDIQLKYFRFSVNW